MSIARLLRIWHHRVRSVVHKDAVDAEVARELSFHFDLLVAEHVTSGMPLDEARRAARQALGNRAALEEECRDQRRVSWLHDLKQDLAYGLRVLLKDPGFTGIAVLSLAIGLGANAATLAVLHALKMQPLPFADADRLVLMRTLPPDSGQMAGVNLGDYLAWRERSSMFETLGLSLGAAGDLAAEHGEPAERIEGQMFDEGMVAVLGVRPLLGRMFTARDPRLGTPGSVIVISHTLWRSRFAGDLSIVGRQIRLSRKAVTIIGVMPPSFFYPDYRTDYWAPMWALHPSDRDDARLYTVVGRLRPGARARDAEAELTRIAGDRWGVRARPLREVLYDWATAPIATVQAAVALVLLLACANIAALLLARGAARQPELALRMALGASEGRIARQLLTESVLLSCLGCALAVLVAWASVGALRMLAPLPGQAPVPHVSADARMLLLLALLGAGAAMTFGVLPARRGSRLNLVEIESLSGLRPRGATPSPQRLHGVLVSAQMAVAFVLLVAAVLLTTSFARLTSRNLNFDSTNLVTFDFRIPPTEFIRQAGRRNGSMQYHIGDMPSQTIERILERLGALPGVESVAGISHHPVNTIVLARPPFAADSRPLPAGNDGLPPVYFRVTPGFFATMRTPVVRGREFQPTDTIASRWVAIVNETLSRRLWPDEDPIGKRIRVDLSSEELVREVVGVVRDIPTRRAQLQAESVVYVPSHQQAPLSDAPWISTFGRMTFVLRTTRGSEEVVPAVRRAVAEVEPDRPITNVSMRPVERYMWARYSYVFVVTAFAIVATLIASMGVYGVMGYVVSQRRREIGIRIALGADARAIFLAVARPALGIVGAGIAAGLAGALVVTRLVASQLWGITPTDPPTYVAVALLLSLAAGAACLAPLRRALASDPVAALKAE